MNNKYTKASLSGRDVFPDCKHENVQNIRLLIVDDQNFVCQRLKLLLEPEANLEIVAMANDGATAINLIESLQPDVILLDLEMPVMDGVEALEIIARRFPTCKVLVLSSHEDDSRVDRALRAGAKGYLLKNSLAEELINAIRSTNSSYFQLSPGLFEKFATGNTNSNPNLQTTSEASLKQSNSKSEKISKVSNNDNQIFRQESLERLSSPERLDQLMQVVNSKSWIPLAALGFLGVAALIWSIFGRIPVTVEGAGVLINPSKVVPVQTKSSGQLINLKVENGDVIKKGDVIATIDRSDLQKQLARAEDKLDKLQNQNLIATSVQTRRKEQESLAREEQRQSLIQRLQIIEDLTPTLKEKGLSAIQAQRENLLKRQKILSDLAPTFEKRFTTRQTLFKKGAISEDSLLEARQQYSDNFASIDTVRSNLKELDVQESEALQQYLTNLNEIKNIQAELQELDSQKASLNQQDLETSTSREKETQEVRGEIAQLEQDIDSESKILSQYSGTILELTVAQGQVVEAGTRLASIDTNSEAEKLLGITYFPVKDGKKVEAGMELQITPNTIKRERFGGIVGTVKSVSSFPVTTEAAAKVVGNAEIIRSLVSDTEPVVIQISASLEPELENFSGYEWSSSSGPNLKISSGTTASARVKVEERAPITFVFPILRSISGIY